MAESLISRVRWNDPDHGQKQEGGKCDDIVTPLAPGKQHQSGRESGEDDDLVECHGGGFFAVGACGGGARDPERVRLGDEVTEMVLL